MNSPGGLSGHLLRPSLHDPLSQKLRVRPEGYPKDNDYS